jgi:hypothetical protein
MELIASGKSALPTHLYYIDPTVTTIPHEKGSRRVEAL